MIYEFKGKRPKIHKTAFVSETSAVIGDVEIKGNSSIWFGAVIRGDSNSIKIGKNTNIQDNCVLHTDPKNPLFIGNNVSVGHGAIIHGCKIGSNCIIGMGAIILSGARIGEWCIIGAEAVVREGQVIPRKSLAVGVPARIARKLEKKDLNKITENAKEYTMRKEIMKEACRLNFSEEQGK